MHFPLSVATRILALAPPVLFSAGAIAAQTDHSDPVGHHADSGHGGFSNEVMFFIGDTRKGGDNALTVGVDYLRALGTHWGAAVFLDYAHGELEREYIAGAGLFWAPVPALPDLHLFVGGGWEGIDEDHVHSDGNGGEIHEWEHEDLILGRVGGTFVRHFGDRGRWVLAPQLFYDVVEGSGRDAVVFGVGLGLLF